MGSCNEAIRVVSEEIGEHKVLVVSKGDKTVLLDTMYDENSFFNTWMEEQHIPNSIGVKVILFGLGNGIIARKILESFSEAFVLAVEPSKEILSHVSQEYSLKDLLTNKRFALFSDNQYDSDRLASFLATYIKYKDTENYCILAHPNYRLLFEQELMLLADALSTVISGISVDFDFAGDYGAILNKNTFSNLKYFAKSKSFEGLTDGSLKEYPAIIVAAGPSLDKNILDIKDALGKAIIVAVDAAMIPLAKAGIKPDFLVAVDPCKDGRYLKDEESKYIPMITTLSSSGEMVATHLGDKFFISDTRIYISRFLRDNEIYIPLLPTGGSVANNALSLVTLFGCTDIILVGQDLGFTGEKTHAGSSIRENDKASDYGTFCTDVDIYGNEIGTCGEFRLFKKWMENFIDANPSINVIDATEGGALIKGTKISTLKEAIAEYCKGSVDVSSIVDNCPFLLSEKLQEELFEYMNSLLKNYSNSKAKLSDLVNKYYEMERMICGREYRNNHFVELSKEANDILNFMESDISMEYVRDVIQDKRNKMIKSINSKKETLEEDLLYICEQGRVYAECMIEAIDIVIREVNDRFVSKQ